MTNAILMMIIMLTVNQANLDLCCYRDNNDDEDDDDDYHDDDDDADDQPDRVGKPAHCQYCHLGENSLNQNQNQNKNKDLQIFSGQRFAQLVLE